MSGTRFVFQQDCVRRALADLDGPALNVGCNEDPGKLKDIDPERVVNCDLFAHDAVMDRPNRVDRLFDCASEPWPFDHYEASIVVLGDIVEHLTPAEIDHALAEARRVGRRLCVTVPEDHRDTVTDAHADTFPRGAVHRTIVTQGLLERALLRAGWYAYEFRRVDYQPVVPYGYFVEAD